MTDYQEIWRDITATTAKSSPSWILQSSDGSAFIGKVGAIYLAIQQVPGGFAVRRQDREAGNWVTSYESGDVGGLPVAAEAVEALETGDRTWAEGQTVSLGATEYIFRGFSTD